MTKKKLILQAVANRHLTEGLSLFLNVKGVEVPEDHFISLGKGEIVVPEGQKDGRLEIAFSFQRMREAPEEDDHG